MRNLDRAAAFTASTEGDTHWVEHLRVDALSLGTYSVRAGGVDDQTPHQQDEVYFVASGTGWFEAGGERVPVAPGTTLYVPAREVHRFVDVSSDLAVVVLFAPPESEG